jgi:hypothetical protein
MGDGRLRGWSIQSCSQSPNLVSTSLMNRDVGVLLSAEVAEQSGDDVMRMMLKIFL